MKSSHFHFRKITRTNVNTVPNHKIASVANICFIKAYILESTLAKMTSFKSYIFKTSIYKSLVIKSYIFY